MVCAARSRDRISASCRCLDPPFWRRRKLKWGLASQSAALLATAVFLHQGQNAAGFAAAIVATTAVATTRPAQSVLTPSMVDGPDELTAANVLSGALRAGAGLAGPAIAAVIMTEVGSWAVFALMAAVVAASTAASWRLPSWAHLE